jgi:hypothetical protein
MFSSPAPNAVSHTPLYCTCEERDSLAVRRRIAGTVSPVDLVLGADSRASPSPTPWRLRGPCEGHHRGDVGPLRVSGASNARKRQARHYAARSWMPARVLACSGRVWSRSGRPNTKRRHSDRGLRNRRAMKAVVSGDCRGPARSRSLRCSFQARAAARPRRRWRCSLCLEVRARARAGGRPKRKRVPVAEPVLR